MLDVIRVNLPNIGAEEYFLRDRLRTARDVATLKIADLVDGRAKDLCWQAVETSTAYLLAPAPLGNLHVAVEHCRELLAAAHSAGRLEGLHP